jgi:hypothetical protein
MKVGTGIMNNKYYPRFTRRLRIVTMTSMIALVSLMVVPISTGVTYAQTTNAQIQALLSQVSILKSALQAQSTQISQMSAALRAGAGPSLSAVTKQGPVVILPPGKNIESRVDCPTGSVATGGGHDTLGDPGNPSLQFVQSFPHIIPGLTPIGWIADEFNPTNTTHYFGVIAVCANVTQGTVSR